MFGPPFTPLKVTILVIVAAVLWGSFVWDVRKRWRENRQRKELLPERGLRPERDRRWDRRKVFMCVFVAGLLLIGVGLGFVDQFGSPLARARLHWIDQGMHVFIRCLFIALGVLVVLWVALFWLNRDPVLKTAAKLALAGKHSEAERLVRERIATKGPNEKRVTVLGLLLMEQNRLEEALCHLEEAQRLSTRPDTAKNNRAMVLWKLGRKDEAIALLDDVCRANPKNLTALCNSCLLLAEMGRETEAYERLEQAEQICERYDARYTKEWTAQLEKCRQAVPTARGFPVILTAQGGKESQLTQKVRGTDDLGQIDANECGS
jgi:tetratricopeptide (TPR) repeat protein